MRERGALKTKRMREKQGKRRKRDREIVKQPGGWGGGGVVVMYLQCSMSVQLYFTASSSRRQ